MIDRRWRDARRILAIRLDNLGDVLITTPAIHALKTSLPETEITLLASPVGAQAGRLDPDLADVIVYEAPWVDPWSRLPHDSDRERTMIETLRQGQFDAAVIFTSYHQSSLPAAYLCYLGDIPLRLAASIDAPGSLLTTRHRHPERPMHEVERGLDLVGAIGCTADETDLVLRVPSQIQQRITRRLADFRGPLVVVHPGCSMPARTAPPEQFAAIISSLINELGATVILTGTNEERQLVAAVATGVPMAARQSIYPVAGELSFAELCGLIGAADLVVTNNTGPMHIAAAVKTPVAVLFALTNPPEQWGPWRVPHRLLYHDVPCRLCYSRVCPYEQECLRGVPTAEVIRAAGELLATARYASSSLPGASRRLSPEIGGGYGRGARPCALRLGAG